MRIARRKPLTGRTAVISVGLDTYWKQFPGLRDELNQKTIRLLQKLRSRSVEVIDLGMVDNAASAYKVLPELQAADPDVLFVDMVTYATSATFAAIIREISCPVVLVALQPQKARDYARGTTYMQLCNDDFCSGWPHL